uniref:Laminin EGF-like domain-containing protein n=1 Tax=Macrostomum lignano TaxID=282301 RepID=A0A1I8JS10_9PLAT
RTWSRSATATCAKAASSTCRRATRCGCSPCFCFGAGLGCSSARGIITLWSSSRDWTIVTNDGRSYAPRIDEYPVLDSYSVKRNLPNLTEDQPLYWRAPPGYLSNLHTAYGGEIVLIISFEDASDSIIWLERLPLMRILADLRAPGRPASASTWTCGRCSSRKVGPSSCGLPLRATRDQSGPAPEDGHWINERQFKATEEELRSRLVTARGIEVLAKYSLRQRSADLRQLGIPAAGYSGLSCEACQPGYRRVFNRLMGGDCAKCDCNGQSDVCDANTGACGDHCERCRPGYYGNPKAGVPCRHCELPRQFSSRCQLRPGSARDYICENCAEGHTGAHCEQCRCVVDTCDTVSGRCKACSFNTEGERCETCQDGFYGTAANRGCRPCDCLPDGSESGSCHAETGQCRRTSRARNATAACPPRQPHAGCPPCRCNSRRQHQLATAARQLRECACLPGVAGPHCKALPAEALRHEARPRPASMCNCRPSTTRCHATRSPASAACGPRQQGRNCTCEGAALLERQPHRLPALHNCNAVGSDNSELATFLRRGSASASGARRRPRLRHLPGQFLGIRRVRLRTAIIGLDMSLAAAALSQPLSVGQVYCADSSSQRIIGLDNVHWQRVGQSGWTMSLARAPFSVSHYRLGDNVHWRGLFSQRHYRVGTMSLRRCSQPFIAWTKSRRHALLLSQAIYWSAIGLDNVTGAARRFGQMSLRAPLVVGPSGWTIGAALCRTIIRVDNVTGVAFFSWDNVTGTALYVGRIDRVDNVSWHGSVVGHYRVGQCHWHGSGSRAIIGWTIVTGAALPAAFCYDGQRCDKLTGQCNCPPNTFGRKVRVLRSPGTGTTARRPVASPAAAIPTARLTSQCNLDTGNCSCRQGFAGDRCDRCDAGFHSFPRCQRCHCNWDGARWKASGTFAASDGSCFCKPAVTGRDCLDCVSGTFARLVGYSRGCIGCYCSGTGAACRSDSRLVQRCGADQRYATDGGRERAVWRVRRPGQLHGEFPRDRGSVGYLDIPLRQFVT